MNALCCDCCGAASRQLLVNAVGAVCQRCHDRYSMFAVLALHAERHDREFVVVEAGGAP